MMANLNESPCPETDERFMRHHHECIKHYQNVLNQLRVANPIIPEPCILSKLDGALEYLLVKWGCKVRYNLANDHGWMVPRTYNQVPRPFTFGNQEFSVLLLSDPELRYIMLDFGEKCYIVFGFTANLIPWIDDENDSNVERLTILWKHLTKHYFLKTSQNRSTPSMPKEETIFINTNVFSDANVDLDNVQQSSRYRRYGLLDPNWSIMTRLFRTVVFLIEDAGCDVEMAEDSPYMLNYTGAVLKLRYFNKNYFFCLVEGLHYFLFSLKDEEHNFISAHRIPFSYVPEFSMLPAIINFDNNRFQALARFLNSILIPMCDVSLNERISDQSDDSDSEGQHWEQSCARFDILQRYFASF